MLGSMRWTWCGVGLAFVGIVCVGEARADETILTMDGEVPDDELDHFFVPFEVPAGIVEIEVRHDDLSTMNILDWGLQGPDGFRGWGGGNEEPAIVGVEAASRSYLPGPIEPGQWQVIVGKARISDPPGTYAIEVVLRDEPTLDPQPRTPYGEAPALRDGPGWFAGDFHVHSVQSGDARPPLSEVAQFAAGRGLDFVVITDHNVHSGLDFFAEARMAQPSVLLIPGVEFTTYAGHGNAIGATEWVDHKIGQPGVTIDGAIAAYHGQGALFSINHPAHDLGPLCIGCAWEHDVDPGTIDAVEIASGGLQPFGWQFTPRAIEFWDALCAQGHHIAAIGGSDDHNAGVDLSQFQSPIGDPTTLVWAERLDVASILEGVRNGRTVVKLQGPDDPTLLFAAVEPIDRDTIRAPEVTLTATILGGAGAQVRLVHDGAAQPLQAIDDDPFEAQWTVQPPAQGQARYRVEILVDGAVRVITSHLWVEAGDDPNAGTDSTGTGAATDTAAGDSGSSSDSGCGCASPGSDRRSLLPALALLLLARRRGAGDRGAHAVR
jgi:hypothetical protein